MSTTNINLIRAAEINYTTLAGDTFAPPPVAFTIDSTPESFTGSTIKMQVKQGTRLLKEITHLSGITVSTNTLQYTISATDMALIPAGVYQYDVQKTTSGVVVTIQKGTITIKKDTTT